MYYLDDKTGRDGKTYTNKMAKDKIKKFRKVVKYDWSGSSFFAEWLLFIVLALTYPIWYIPAIRDVHWEEIKDDK